MFTQPSLFLSLLKTWSEHEWELLLEGKFTPVLIYKSIFGKFHLSVMRNRLLLRHFIAVGGNSACEVGDMGWTSQGGWEEEPGERKRTRKGWFFSNSTVRSINQTYLPSTNTSSPPALWLSPPGQAWVHSKVGWKGVTHSLSGDCWSWLQTLANKPIPTLIQTLCSSAPNHSYSIPWVMSTSCPGGPAAPQTPLSRGK